MAEIFRQIRPDVSLSVTGERFVPGLGGEIEAEHLHRYFLARGLCKGKRVADIASGEGYGAALLAQTAASVIGIEIDPQSVTCAEQHYRLPNLRFIQADAARLPLEAASVDVVVSFETLEHLTEPSRFVEEVRRVLAPGGFAVISTPDASVYSAPGSHPNPFHIREYSGPEYRDLLTTFFPNVHMFRQRVVLGSALLPETAKSEAGLTFFERRNGFTFETHPELPRARYLIAIVGQSDVFPPAGSLYIDNEFNEAANTELERLREVEAAFREHLVVSATVSAKSQELDTELHRLRRVESASRELSAAHERLVGEADDMRRELQRLREVDAKATEDAAILVRQQTLVINRLRYDMDRALVPATVGFGQPVARSSDLQFLSPSPEGDTNAPARAPEPDAARWLHRVRATLAEELPTGITRLFVVGIHRYRTVRRMARSR